jgi:hypothetical protein
VLLVTPLGNLANREAVFDNMQNDFLYLREEYCPYTWNFPKLGWCFWDFNKDISWVLDLDVWELFSGNTVRRPVQSEPTLPTMSEVEHHTCATTEPFATPPAQYYEPVLPTAPMMEHQDSDMEPSTMPQAQYYEPRT